MSEILISFFSLLRFFRFNPISPSSSSVGRPEQSTTDNEEREREREREENNYASQYRQQQQQQALQIQQQQQQQQQQFNYPGHVRQPTTPNHFQHPDNIINENRQNIRHHIKPKTSLINNNNPDTTSLNLNNNNINITNNNHKGAKFGVQQVNSSSKMLDNQKYQKYFSKRKLVQQYENEMRAEKRNRLEGDSIDDDEPGNLPLNMRRSQSTNEDDARSENGKSVGLNLIQNIKTEKGDDDHTDVNGNEDNGDTIGFYGTHLGKIKHSILEPNIVLQHSDEVISPTNGSKSIANSLQNPNLSQKTAS
jgi:hypothetical protein